MPKKIKIPLILFALILLIMAILLFPFLRGEKLYIKDFPLKEGKAIVISDLHLENNPRDLECIGNYIDSNNISTVIFNGDLFDRKHKEKFDEKLIKEAKKKLGIKDKKLKDIILILALYGHDPYLEGDKKEVLVSGENFNTLIIEGGLKLQADDETFYIAHGDFATTSTGVAGMSLINKITSGLYYEKFAKKVADIEDDDWLLLGHSHIFGIDYKNKVANSGCWIKRIVSNTDTIILIENTRKKNPKISLIKIPCE